MMLWRKLGMRNRPRFEDRVRNPTRVEHIGHQQRRADAHQQEVDPKRQHVEAEGGRAEHEQRQPQSGLREADPVEIQAAFLADVGDEECGEHDAEDADRDVDPEDPRPARIGRHEAADRRSKYRAEQAGHGEPGEGGDEFRLADGAQDHQPPDRHHHGAADALDDAGEDQHLHRACRAAEHRAHREDEDGDTEDVPRPETCRRASRRPAGTPRWSAGTRSGRVSGGSGWSRSPGQWPAAPLRRPWSRDSA